MSGTGRPLRFLAMVLGLWLSARVLMLAMPLIWPADAMSQRGTLLQQAPIRDHGRPAPAQVPLAALPAPAPAARMTAASVRSAPRPVRPRPTGALDALPAPVPGWNDAAGDGSMGLATHYRAARRASGTLRDRLTDAVTDGPGLADAVAAGQRDMLREDGGGRRWSATAWLLWRPESVAGLMQGPLLGGSQAGARIDYRVREGPAGRLGAYARVSRALVDPAAEEAAVGLAYRPGRLPVSLLAERRQRIGPGGRSGFALMAAGGAGPLDVAPRVAVEGYAQAGVVGAPGLAGFADGKGSLGYRMGPGGDPHGVTLGASVSGSVQPGASRLDVGPELHVRLPVSDGALRLSTEWRERIAGDARPARGPTVTLIAIF